MKSRIKSLCVTALLSLSGAASALSFNFTFLPDTSQQAKDAFNTAAASWSSLLIDDVKLNMTVGLSKLADGQVGEATTPTVSVAYSTFFAALAGDVTSFHDVVAFGSLQRMPSAGVSFGMLVNRTANSEFGAGSAEPYKLESNETVWLTPANAKALGGLGTSSFPVGNCEAACESSIAFNSSYAYDYNRADGINANQLDFIGIATHEIGHALGFISSVDTLDIKANSGTFLDGRRIHALSLDLFRYSALSKTKDVIDLTADERDKFFSIDGSDRLTGPQFSTGMYFGDGNQASHWKDRSPLLGIMDPNVGYGQLLEIRENDLIAMDVIGWDRANPIAPIPEPSTYALMGLGLAALALRRRIAGKGR